MYDRELAKGWWVMDRFNNHMIGASVEMSGQVVVGWAFFCLASFPIWSLSSFGLFLYLVSFSLGGVDIST